MVTKWQSTDQWWKSSMERELQPGKITLKGSGKSILLLFYLLTGLCLCWCTSREPGAVNLDVNVSSLWGAVSMALPAPTFWGQCLYNVYPHENCWNQTWCICCGWNTYVHPHSKEKKSWLKLSCLNCHSCFWEPCVAEDFAFWRCRFCWTSLALGIRGSAQ